MLATEHLFGVQLVVRAAPDPEVVYIVVAA
jgi:hypothetical protein